jgi:hypothetical protein
MVNKLSYHCVEQRFTFGILMFLSQRVHTENTYLFINFSSRGNISDPSVLIDWHARHPSRNRRQHLPIDAEQPFHAEALRL